MSQLIFASVKITSSSSARCFGLSHVRRHRCNYIHYRENMHSESWQAHPHQANRDWHAPRAHQSVQHQRASSVDRKCQTYAQGITVEVILCKYSRHQDIHASCGCCFTPRLVLSSCGQKRIKLKRGAWECRVSQNIHLTTEAFKE